MNPPTVFVELNGKVIWTRVSVVLLHREDNPSNFFLSKNLSPHYLDHSLFQLDPIIQ